MKRTYGGTTEQSMTPKVAPANNTAPQNKPRTGRRTYGSARPIQLVPKDDGDYVPKKKKKHGPAFEIITFILWCVAIIVAVNLFFRFFKFPVVIGSSMESTYSDGDRLLVLTTKNLEPDDIVVIWSDQYNEYIVKRVIGIAGDQIEIKEDGVYRNAEKIDEPYVNEANWIQETDLCRVMVPENSIFVMGDNRLHSSDSRELGSFSLDKVYGKVLLRMNWLNFILPSK